MSYKLYIQLISQVIICFGLTLFCFLILLDGIADYKIWRPIIFTLQFILLPIWLVYTHIKVFKTDLNWKKSIGVAMFVLISDILVLLTGTFSLLVWLDLADGKTQILLP
jgi:hypothetical protein